MSTGADALKEIQRKLESQAKKTGIGGAMPRATKQKLLDASDVQARHPDKRIRWVNTINAEKMAGRQADGYVLLTEAEGQRRRGNLALAMIDRAVYDERVAEVERMNRERLKAHEAEVSQVIEAVAREMRDRYGLKVDLERLIVRD